MKITKEQIDRIKQQYELVATVEAHGVRLKKRGKEYVGLCPFHKEKTPSFSVAPIKQLFHCFGCGASGDTLGFLSKIENKALSTLIKELSHKTNGAIPIRLSPAMKGVGSNGALHSQPSTDNANPPTVEGVKSRETSSVVGTVEPLNGADHKDHTAVGVPIEPHSPAGVVTPKLLKLLARVVEFYQGVFTKDPKGREYLSGRGIQDKEALRDFGVGYANGSLLDALPPEGDLLSDLKAIGILTEHGREFFSDCIVIPLRDLSGAVTGLYGRKINDSEPHHLYLPGPRRGLINWQAAKRSTTILLTEAIIDALTLYDQGFKNVIPCYGVTGLSEEHIACFKQFGRHENMCHTEHVPNGTGVKEVMICFDSDEAGKKGAASAVNRLSDIGITCSVITFPCKDINDYFRRHTPEEFEALVKDAHPLTPIRSETIASRAESLFEATDAGFRIGFGDRVYEVKGVHRQGVQLRVTLLVTRNRVRHDL